MTSSCSRRSRTESRRRRRSVCGRSERGWHPRRRRSSSGSRRRSGPSRSWLGSTLRSWAKRLESPRRSGRARSRGTHATPCTTSGTRIGLWRSRWRISSKRRSSPRRAAVTMTARRRTPSGLTCKQPPHWSLRRMSSSRVCKQSSVSTDPSSAASFSTTASPASSASLIRSASRSASLSSFAKRRASERSASFCAASLSR
mmetsp:Transcript_16348/g.53428  ORF Transcript_16348/g.53428 Transcript_16348/m.53428 type:complete len:200 (+) Transcript_16348:295-894(+)